MTYEDRLNNLTDWSVWVFTKQSISFDTAFKAVRLLSEMPNRESENVEQYFTDNHERYGIATDRHRELIIAQLLGLLTKTPPYARGGRYNTEQPTEIFELLSKCDIGSKEYNTLKTEQLLKVKIKAIIDTASNNENRNILPVVFSYKVLRTLKEKYNINSVKLDLFYTYVMTCADYGEADDAVEYIRSNSPITAYVSKYKDRSRFLTLVKGNLNLFNITHDEISLNDSYDDYFNDNFMEKFDIDELNIQLSRDVDYTYLLTSFQDFGINLIDAAPEGAVQPVKSTAAKIRKKKLVQVSDDAFEDDDADYVDKVDEIKEYNINIEIGKDAFKNKPNAPVGIIAKRYSKNPIIGKIAVKQAGYCCEIDNSHQTFISSKTTKQFMEAHHLIPISFQDEMWGRYRINIDCVENIVSLCPNCHRAIHYARKEDKIDVIHGAFDLKKSELEKIGLNISVDEIVELYY